MGILFLSLSVLIASCGQIFFKLGINKIQAEGFEYYLALAKSYWIYLGFFSYGISFLIWLRVLSYFDVSFARPLTSIGYIITYVMAIFLLGEVFTIRRAVAIALITIGALLLR